MTEQADQPVRPRRSRARLLLGLAAAVLVLDVVTKLLVVATLIRPASRCGCWAGRCTSPRLRNTGAAFSFAEGATVVFTLIAVAVVVVIVRSARRLYSTGWAVALALVLGGAVGNLLDRVFRDPGFLRGGVVDFVSRVRPLRPGVADLQRRRLGDRLRWHARRGARLRGIEFDGGRSSSTADAT